MNDHLKATSTYIPDTVLHGLNGLYVVHIGGMRSWLTGNVPWLSPDEAEAFADSLRRAAAHAREKSPDYDETDDDDAEDRG